MNRRKIVNFRRKRKGFTNYKKRLKLVSSGKIRLVIRRFLNTIIIQFVKFNENGDKILITTTSKQLKKIGWNYHTGNLPAAYLTGLIAGTKVKDVKECVLDIGLSKSVKGSAFYTALKGVLDAGIKVNCSEDIFPSESRIKGEHIAKYAISLKDNKEAYAKQFSKYLKDGVNPEDMVKKFDEIKSQILKEK